MACFGILGGWLGMPLAPSGPVHFMSTQKPPDGGQRPGKDGFCSKPKRRVRGSVSKLLHPHEDVWKAPEWKQGGQGQGCCNNRGTHRGFWTSGTLSSAQSEAAWAKPLWLNNGLKQRSLTTHHPVGQQVSGDAGLWPAHCCMASLTGPPSRTGWDSPICMHPPAMALGLLSAGQGTEVPPRCLPPAGLGSGWVSCGPSPERVQSPPGAIG